MLAPLSHSLPLFCVGLQNLGEAEYLVSLYQYMRLLGYPASRISILTTYNGQKALLRDVIERRCANHPAFGRPAKVRSRGADAVRCAYALCQLESRRAGFSLLPVCSGVSLPGQHSYIWLHLA